MKKAIAMMILLWLAVVAAAVGWAWYTFRDPIWAF